MEKARSTKVFDHDHRVTFSDLPQEARYDPTMGRKKNKEHPEENPGVRFGSSLFFWASPMGQICQNLNSVVDQIFSPETFWKEGNRISEHSFILLQQVKRSLNKKSSDDDQNINFFENNSIVAPHPFRFRTYTRFRSMSTMSLIRSKR